LVGIVVIPYQRSYNCNGRFYTLHDPSRYDRHGLLSLGDAHFSKDGSLRATVKRLALESLTGMTQRELQDMLRVRVQVQLLALLEAGEVYREHFEGLYVYLHTEPEVRKAQLEQRKQRKEALVKSPSKVSDAIIIQVLLVLIRHPGSKEADVARRLKGHSPPITLQQVESVFSRYSLSEKKGAMSS